MARDLLKNGEGRFFRGNLHCHSNRSDGLREPEEVVGAYRDAGYDFVCLSDHFEAGYGWWMTDTRPLRDAVNVGATALEELSDGDDAPPADSFGSRGSQRSRPTPIRNAQRASAQDTRVAEDNGRTEEPPAPASSSRRGASGKARKSQVDLLKTLAVEWRGENGVERLENRIGKPLANLTRAEADEWIDRLTPEGR